MESVPGEGSAPPEEQQAMDHFRDTVVRDEDGRYSVQLPRKSPAPQLGDSRKIAEKRFLQNERALTRKGTWDAFNAAVKEYPDLGHAEEVPTADRSKPPGECYYLPMNGVVKNSSTTTKLRVASAHSESGASLNDQLLSGPSLYPHLTKVVNRFRTHSIGMSSDVSKMFREVGLQPSERDFHRFLMRNDSGDIVDMRMTRLTFGVTSSPFLASKVLRQVADDYEESYPRAAAVVRSNFYVDDCLTGANTLEDATSLRSELKCPLRRSQDEAEDQL